MSEPKRVVVFVTSDLYFVRNFLLNQVKAAVTDYDVHLIANAPEKDIEELFGGTLKFSNLGIQRKISIFRDMRSLILILRYFSRVRPQLVHSTTPKAGLLAMVSARLVRVPVRLHTFTGQVWQTKRGLYRALLKTLDTVTAAAATLILCDSHGQRSHLIDNGVVGPTKSTVLLKGSIRGIDPQLYRPCIASREEVRDSLKVGPDSVLVLYMARFTRDKGALLMAEAFARLRRLKVNAHLLMIGPDEENLTPQISRILSESDADYRLLDYTTTPGRYFAACDVFCLPSYREGFPMVLLNAGSTGVPVVASAIYGTADAVVDKKTGLLFEVGNVDDFVDKLNMLSRSPELRKQMGEDARAFVVSNFSESAITAELMRLYKALISAA
jgi:glycosyltransferase involved in cell wall biosynthesis